MLGNPIIANGIRYFCNGINTCYKKFLFLMLTLFITGCASLGDKGDSSPDLNLPDDIDLFPPPASGGTLSLELGATPLINSVGLLLAAKEGNLSSTSNEVKFRGKNEAQWRDAQPLRWDPVYKKLAGSIIGLKENQEYEVNVTVSKAGSEPATALVNFRTWPSDPPVDPSKVYLLKDLYTGGMLNLVELGISGKDSGWAKIVGDDSVVIDAGTSHETAVNIGSNSFILFENVRIKGGRKYAVKSKKAHDLWFRNCEVSEWGRPADFIQEGLPYEEKEDGSHLLIDKDSAFYLESSGRIVIEKCFVHSPRLGANTWEYGHPRGSSAFHVSTYHSNERYRGQIVIRYNDFVGADRHRFNDVIEGHANGSMHGGFYKNSDIHGNYFAFSNDDLIELDGGQHNVKLYENRMEAAYVGISLIPNMRGPSYVFRNLVHHLGDERGRAWAAFKMGGLLDPDNEGGESLIFHNTVYAPSNGVYGTRYKGERAFLAKTRNNILIGTDSWTKLKYGIHDTAQIPGSNFDYDLIHNIVRGEGAIEAYADAEVNGLMDIDPNFINPGQANFSLGMDSPAKDRGEQLANFNDNSNGAPDMGALELDGAIKSLPHRPITITSSKTRLVFDKNNLQSSSLSLNNTGEEKQYRILMDNHTDWINVEPASGAVISGGEQALTVTIDEAKRKNRGASKGVFIIKFDDGFSIPVSLAVTDQ